MLKVGLTVGKFMPLHKGHELMLKAGAMMMDRFYIIVGGLETDAIPLSKRVRWVKEMFQGNDNVIVYRHHDEIPMEDVNVDEDGTVIDEWFWDEWTELFSSVAPDATHFVSSDKYGAEAARRLGIEWLPVDPDRETFSISGTEIRESIFKNFDMISANARRDMMLKVAIVGPESTGKSTLVNILKKEGYTTVPEYGRILSEHKPDLDVKDFDTIAKMQKLMVDTATRESKSPIVVSDTEAFTTYLFGMFYLNEKMEHIKKQAMEEDFDLYIVLAPTVQWVNDGTRVVDSQRRRQWFFDKMIALLKEKGAYYAVIDNTYYKVREARAVSQINDEYNEKLKEV